MLGEHCLSIRNSPVIFLPNNVFTHECFENCSTFNGSVGGCMLISSKNSCKCSMHKGLGTGLEKNCKIYKKYCEKIGKPLDCLEYSLELQSNLLLTKDIFLVSPMIYSLWWSVIKQHLAYIYDKYLILVNGYINYSTWEAFACQMHPCVAQIRRTALRMCDPDLLHVSTLGYEWP